jgi:hypothetical protein
MMDYRWLNANSPEDVTAYSGRGMFGKQWASVCTEHGVLKYFADLVDNCGPDDMPYIAEMLRTAKTDNMGTGVVIYWPRVSMEGE